VSTAAACHVIDHEGSRSTTFNRENVERLLAAGRFFWLDLPKPGEDDFAVLREKFGFHRLALEDSEHFGQRPKLDDYDDFVFLVVYGAVPDEDRLVEVHCFYSERCLITVRRDESPALADVRRRYEDRTGEIGRPALVLYRIVSALADSFFPILSEFDDRIDTLEDAIFSRGGDDELQEIFEMKRLLVGMRKVIAPQRDVFAAIQGGVDELPGMTDDDERYFRDVYDHMIRVADLIDTYRDLLTGAMDVYLSTVSNRLNVVMKQLAIIATIFLPLTFITGFFGQNFGWLVGEIGGRVAFFGLGVGLEVVAIVFFVILFRRRGWI